MKLKITLCMVCAFVFAASAYSQDVPDWVWKTPMTKVVPTGEYTEKLPVAQDQIQYQNPNTTTRVVNEGGQYFVLPPNVRPFPSPATQSEIDAANMKGNNQVMYISWNSWQNPTFFGCGFAFTSNGGTNWTGSTSTTGSNSGDPGPWIWPTGSTWAGRLGLSYIAGAGFSTNNGATWGGHVPFTGGSSFDKNLSAVDDVTGSPFFGRAYTVWTWFSNNRISISFTTNGGATWSPSTLVSPVPSGGHHHQGCDVEVGPGGVVHVVWGNCTTNGQNSTEDFLGYARSTDGGVTWATVNDNAVDINGIRAANLYNGIRANGFPRLAVDNTGGSRNGWIYVAIGEKNTAPATDVADMCLARSTNNGATWTHTRINQDTPGNGKYQYMGDIDVAPDGSVVCSYYDQRNTTSPVTEYWMSRSTDGGNTWVDVAVSDHTFTPSPIPGLAGGYQGDYTGITTANNMVWPFWADNSSGIYQAWTTGITVGSAGGTLPELIYYKFENNPSPSLTPNCATIAPVGTNPAPVLSTTPLGSAGQFDSCLVGNTTPQIANLGGVNTGWNTVLPANWTISFWLGPNIIDGNPSYLFGDPGATSFRCFYGGAAGVNNILLRGAGLTDVLITGVGITSTVVTITWNGTNIIVYKNGVLFQTFPRTMSSATGTGFRVGSYNTTFVSQLIGKLDEFRFYNRALAPAEITATWNTDLGGCGVPVGISGNNGEIPSTYSLSQNYPNPFNPVTKISFSIPKGGLTKLIIYDILGREVATLVDAFISAGRHELDFDGSKLASGVYLYKLQSANFTETKKMLLVK